MQHCKFRHHRFSLAIAKHFGGPGNAVAIRRWCSPPHSRSQGMRVGIWNQVQRLQAGVGRRSYCSSAQTYSIFTLRPSMNPASPRLFRNAAIMGA